MNQWYAFDSLTNSSYLQDSYYHWSDLCVGAEIDVYSRKIILFNCDEYTKQYYTDYGLGKFCKCAVKKKLNDLQFFNNTCKYL